MRGRTGLAMALAGATAFVCVVGASRPASAARKPDKRRQARKEQSYYELQATVPRNLRQAIYRQLEPLALAAYPRADAGALRAALAESVLRDVQSFGVSRSSGVVMFTKDKAGALDCTVSIPLGAQYAVGLWRREGAAPPGRELRERQESLTMDEARQIAREVFRNIVPTVAERTGYEEGRARADKGLGSFYSFVWTGQAPADSGFGKRTIWIAVRMSDGVVRSVSVEQERIPTFAVAREEIIEQARDAFQQELVAAGEDEGLLQRIGEAADRFDPTDQNLKLQMFTHYTSWAPAWVYIIPNYLETGLAKDMSAWNAKTGEVLISWVLKGGTRAAPYRAPEFFYEATRKNVQAELQELVDSTAVELTRPATQPAPAPDTTP